MLARLLRVTGAILVIAAAFATPLLATSAPASADTVVDGCTIVSNPTPTIFTNCPGANLDNADLSGVNLSYANFSGAGFVISNLSGADLSNANLSSAVLASSDFSNANLSSANLTTAGMAACLQVVEVDETFPLCLSADLNGAAPRTGAPSLSPSTARRSPGARPWRFRGPVLPAP